MLAFELDCTSLAAVLIQRLIRGHIARLRLRTRIGEVVAVQKLQHLKDGLHRGAATLDKVKEKARQVKEQTKLSTMEEEEGPNNSTGREEKIAEGGSRNNHDEKLEQAEGAAAEASVSKRAQRLMCCRLTTTTPTPIRVVGGSADTLAEYRRQAVLSKRAGDTKQAVEYMVKYNTLQAELSKSLRREAVGTLTGISGGVNSSGSSSDVASESGTDGGGGYQLNTETHRVVLVLNIVLAAVSGCRVDHTAVVVGFIQSAKQSFHIGGKGRQIADSNATAATAVFASPSTAELVEQYKQSALLAKRAGDTKLAIEYMVTYKAALRATPQKRGAGIGSGATFDSIGVQIEEAKKKMQWMRSVLVT